MAEPNGIPPGGFDKDVIREAISEVWHYRIVHQIKASPDEHIDALTEAVFARLTRRTPTRDLPQGLCGVKTEHLPHGVYTGSLAPFFCTADQSRREPRRSERRRLENQRHLDS